jgi:hypothetical protein
MRVDTGELAGPGVVDDDIQLNGLVAGTLRSPGAAVSNCSRWSPATRRSSIRTYGVDEAALPTIDRVGAALAVLTRLPALEGCWSGLGDPNEGVILLPVDPARSVALESSPALTPKRAL